MKIDVDVSIEETVEVEVNCSDILTEMDVKEITDFLEDNHNLKFIHSRNSTIVGDQCIDLFRDLLDCNNQKLLEHLEKFNKHE